MDEEKPKKKRKKAVAADDGAGEHKRPWQENLATMAEIKAFVSDRYYLRYNVVRRGVECRRPSSYDHDGTDWQLISDRIVNSLRVELSASKSVRKQDIWDLIESDFTPEFHPFLYYLDHLPPWDGQDYIMELSVSVSVAGGVDKQLLFAECLKKWLVGGMGRSDGGEPPDAGTRRTAGHVQDDVVQLHPASAAALLLHDEDQRCPDDEGRPAGTDAVWADVLRRARHDDTFGAEQPEGDGDEAVGR